MFSRDWRFGSAGVGTDSPCQLRLGESALQPQENFAAYLLQGTFPAVRLTRWSIMYQPCERKRS